MLLNNIRIPAIILSSFLASAVAANAAQADPSDALADARAHVADKDVNAITFRQMDKFYPTEWVEPGNRTAHLKNNILELDPIITLGGEELNFDDALKRTYTNALLVIKDGEVVYENYLNGGNAVDQYMSWSIAKSITSMLLGIAVDRGHIESIDDPVEKYLPNMSGTAFEGVALRHLLTMRGGTSYVEQGPGGYSDLAPLKVRSMHKNKVRFTDIADQGYTKKSIPGEVFNYSTLTASILGRVVEEATGLTLAQATEQYLWRPAGMEDQGFWLLDGNLPEGRALGGGAFNATLRDYGRLGLLMLNDGRAKRKQVISKDWVTESTVYQGSKPVIKGAPRGYQYQWWTMLGTELFEAIGIYGQFISIDPKTNTVIVKMSHWPEKGGAKYNIESIALMNAIRADLAARN